MHQIKIIFLALLLINVFPSCKKYEDGPFISLRSKEERITNTWKAENVSENGEDKTSKYDNLRLTFTKGGDYSVTGSGVFTLGLKGKWNLLNSNKDIQTIQSLGNVITTYRILKLKENELWLQDGNTIFHFIPG